MKCSMEEKNQNSKRRTFLKRIGAASIATASIPSTAMAESESEEKEYNVASQTGTVDPSSRGLSPSERRDFVEKVRKRYGKQATESLSLEPQSQFSADADVDGTLVHSVDGHVETNEATSDHIIDIYETDVYTEDGSRRYIYHHWSTAASLDKGWYVGDLAEFSSYVKHTDYSELKHYQPATSITKNGQDVELELTTTAQNQTGTGSASATGRTTITMLEDTVEYDPNRTSTANDEFAVRWSGAYEGQQELNGFHVEQRPTYGLREFDYKFELVSSVS